MEILISEKDTRKILEDYERKQEKANKELERYKRMIDKVLGAEP